MRLELITLKASSEILLATPIVKFQNKKAGWEVGPKALETKRCDILRLGNGEKFAHLYKYAGIAMQRLNSARRRGKGCIEAGTSCNTMVRLCADTRVGGGASPPLAKKDTER